ncbi:MAG TPA: HAD family phosphatase [Ktedonobacterales bacterium]|nr:HAD family phosphatase [Ktedonobacterales bacterium]
MSIRAVIFDLMDVLLLAEDKDTWHQWEASAGVAEGGLARAMFQSPQFPEAISGDVPEVALWRDVAQTLGVTDEPERLAAVFYAAFRLNNGLVEFIRALRPRYKTTILTNTPSDMRAILTQRFHLDREVDAIIISSEEGMRKPQPEMFQLALARLGVTAPEAVFVDDEARYIAAAQALGMYAVPFQDNAQAIPELERLLRQHG